MSIIRWRKPGTGKGTELTLLNYALLIISGFSFGILAAAGVFTVLIAVGLVPRFAGRTDTADHILFYEDCVVFGTITGMLFSVFEQLHPYSKLILMPVRTPAEIIIGFFTGCFVGCLALSIAEMLDSIPIFARRVRLKWGIGIAILFVALGKMAGALLYFIQGIE